MTEEKKKIRRFKSSHLIAVLLALAATAWIGSGVVSGNGADKSAEAPEPKKPTALPLVRVMQSAAQTQEREVILFGRTQAINQADIAAEITGRIIRKRVNKGDLVKAGQILLQLSMDDRMSQLAQAKAKLESQDIAYNAAKKLSQKQFQSQVKLAQEKASLESAKAALDAIETEIAKTAIRAPIDGVVNDFPLSVGDYVKSGDIVAIVVNLSPLRIVGQVSERDVSRIRQDSQAVALLPDGRKLQGEIYFAGRVFVDAHL